MRSRALVAPALLLLSALAVADPARAQQFTRITDAANPVVADTWLSGGASWIDLVGDGYLDLFVANGNLSDQPNQLYRNDRAGGFVRVVAGPIPADGGSSIGGTFGDFDNDGFPDLFVTNRNAFGNFLYRGLGDTLFAKVAGAPATDIANSNSGSWVDLDLDGDLDLYVVNFQGNDFLYVNGGAPGFALGRIDTTAATPGAEFSIPGAWGDYDADGDPDLFIGNAGTQNDYLYTNHGGLYFTRTVIADGLSTLGASWGDWDNDGDLDLVAAHFVNQQNTLYRNGGPPSFALTPVAGPVSADQGNWIGTAFGDYDNDGALDLYVSRDGGAGALFHNDGPPSYGFTKVLTEPMAVDAGNAFGAVWGDYDRDGQLDLFVVDRLGAGNRLYRNGGTANHWLTVRCRGTLSNRSGIGAKVRLLATIGGAPRWQMREVAGQTGYNSQNLDQHFGLGDAAVAESLIVEWPSGRRDAWAGVSADTLLFLDEGAGTVGIDPGPFASGRGFGLRVLPNPARGWTEIAFTLERAAEVAIALYDLQGRRVMDSGSRRLEAGAHRRRITLPSGAPAGIYLCRVSDGARETVARIVTLR